MTFLLSAYIGTTKSKVYEIALNDHPGGKALSILTRSSKTVHEHQRIKRILHVNGSSLRPVFIMPKLHSLMGKPVTAKCISHASFRNRLVQVMKWAVVGTNIFFADVNTHSLRAGGAAALFPSGVDWVGTQRRGS